MRIRILIFGLILAFGLALAQAEVNKWQVVSRMPVPVKGAQAIEYNGLIYILGGFSDSTYSATNLIQVFDPEDNSWQILPDTLKVPRYGFSADNYRNSLVMFGSEFAPDSTLEMWDFTGQTYFYDAKKIFARQFATCQVIGNNLFIFGGFPGLNHEKQPYLVEYYVPGSRVTYARASSFDEISYAETDIIQQASALLGDKIYLFGGALNGILNDIYRFNFQTHEFKKLEASLITARSACAAVSLGNNNLFVIGGYNEVSKAIASTEHLIVNFVDDIEYSSLLDDLNIPRSELCAVAYQDSLIYIFGGQDEDGNCVGQVEKLHFWIDATPVENHTRSLPRQFELRQNYPNPFNSQTVIGFSVAQKGVVELNIFDISGHKVKTLMNDFAAPGSYRLRWDGRDEKGRELPSGIYFYRLKSKSTTLTRRLILMR